MEARLVEFARLLRQNGVRVSPDEVADAGRAAAMVGVAERDDFRAALRATLVKRAADVPLFEQLFALHFSGLGRVLEGLERGLLAQLAPQGARDAEGVGPAGGARAGAARRAQRPSHAAPQHGAGRRSCAARLPPSPPRPPGRRRPVRRLRLGPARLAAHARLPAHAAGGSSPASGASCSSRIWGR